MIDRRTFGKALGTGAATAALAGLPGTASATVPRSTTGAPVVPSVAPGAHTAFPALKQIRAGLLDVGYAELGPVDGPGAPR